VDSARQRWDAGELITGGMADYLWKKEK